MASFRCAPAFHVNGAVLLGTAFWAFLGAPIGRPGALAQGITTAVIRGNVLAADAADVDGTTVTVTNTVTGFSVAVEARQGRFHVAGLEAGGPYVVRVQRIGYVTQEQRGVRLTLGEPVALRFVLEPTAIGLDTLEITADPTGRALAHGGTGATLPDSLLHRLPTLDRDLYDFVRLVPQISTRVGFRWGFSGGGGNIRYNNFLINGVPERTLVNATAALAGGRSIPLDAIREYEVLVAPYDVRYGDFAGALVNSVTRAGTNRWQGSAFAFVRNDGLARREAGDRPSAPYDRWQYGLTVGGPLARDRVHFFLATELQRLSSPAPGPWLGQPDGASPVPVSAADVGRIQAILREQGLEAGSGGAVASRSPLTNVFGRLDVALPAWDSRATVWANYDRSAQDFFSRDSAGQFPLSSMRSAQRRESTLVSLQIHTALPRAGGGHNELLLSTRWGDFGWAAPVHQPVVEVNVASPSGGITTVGTGTFEQAHGDTGSRFRNANIVDNLTLPIGPAHVLTVGVAAELLGNTPGGSVPGSYGAWTFSSLDSLANGTAERYLIRRDFGSASIPLSGEQFAAYVSDEWQVGATLSATLGLRAEVLGIGPGAPYNPVVDSIFDRRTDELPRRRVHLSPRVGFVWTVDEARRDRVRGGIGVFTGRAPPWWLYTALTNYGVGIGQLRCGPTALDRGPAPPFQPDRARAPLACLSGPALTQAPAGDVDLLARDLGPARALRLSLAYDRLLPWDLRATVEALGTRNLADFEFVNLNLLGPQAVDRHGRVLYGSIATGATASSGVATPALRCDTCFTEVIDLRNNSRNHALQLSVRLERRFSAGQSLLASYTFTRVRDVQTPLRTAVRGTVNWSARAVSGRHDDDRPGNSLNDVPHRVVLAGTIRAPWRWPTELAFYYVGESGSPFTYIARGAGSRGDLNADGSLNDPIYVPRSAADTSEIRFAGDAGQVRSQQAAFERRIDSTPCLKRQRGGIVERNSCREPWSHTTVALVRQPVPLGRHTVEMELQAFNLLDLLRRGWGQVRLARPPLLEHVAHTEGTPASAQPVFFFDPTVPEWTTSFPESRFQLQLAMRYRF